MYGIIGGSGLTNLPELIAKNQLSIETPYGPPSGPILIGEFDGAQVAFLPRHGPGHTIAPHLINYRANIWALRNAGVDEIVSVASVGGIRSDMGPETIMLPDQLIDYTWGRLSTYFQDGAPVTHVDMTEPYSSILRQKIAAAAERIGEHVLVGGVYATTQGPRLETAAEINRLERDGADVVGMTGMPEAALARELAIPYATIGVVVNHAAGRGDSRTRIRMEDLEAALSRTILRVQRILTELTRA
jgi:5'-methylthioinosine phosphorylase